MPDLPGGLLPVFVLDDYPGLERAAAAGLQPRRAAPLRGGERGRRARAVGPAELLFANHVLMGGAVGARLGGRYRVKAHGSELEYSIRGRPELAAAGAREPRAAPRRPSSAPSTSARCSPRSSGAVGPVASDAARGRRRGIRPGRRAEALAGLARRGPRTTRPNPGNADERLPDAGNAARLERFLAGERPTVVYFGKLIENKGVQLLLEALAALDARARRRRLRRLPRRARAPRGRLPAGRCSSPGRSSTATSSTCSRSPTPPSSPRSSRRPSAWSPPRRPPAAARRSSRATPGSPRSPPASSSPIRRASRHLRRLQLRRRRTTCARGSASCSRCPAAERAALRARPRAQAVEAALVVGERGDAPARAGRVAFRRMGEEQRLSPSEQLATPREAFEAGTDFTVAVEEEFALLDPETLALVDRFEELKAARSRQRARRAPRRRADRLGGRGAHRALPRLRRGRRGWSPSAAPPCRRSPASTASLLGATGTHPWSRWQDQRIIDTPHYRRNDEILRYVVWRNNTFGLHVHVGIRGSDRAVAGLQRAAPLPARAARALGELARSSSRSTAACTRRARRSSRARSRAAASRTPTTAGAATRSTSPSSTAPARSTSTPSCGGACGRTSPTRRSRSGSATPSPTSARRSRSPRSPTRSRRAARARTTRVSRCSTCRAG